VSAATVQFPRPQLSRRARIILLSLLGVAVLVGLFVVFTGLFTDWLWFRSVGYTSVFATRLRAELLLFLVVGIVTAAAVAANIVIAYRLRPRMYPDSPEQVQLDRYRQGLHPFRYVLLGLASVIILVATGSGASARWQTWLLWRHGVHFGVIDPQFHRDVSYFAFTYPFQRFVLGSLFTIVVLSILAAAAMHYIYGSLRLQTRGEKVSAAARAHLSVLLGMFVALKAIAYYLDRYGLAFSGRGVVTGPSYTDVNAVLPAKTILLVIAIICALLFFANALVRNWTLPAVGFGLMVLSAVVIGGLYPLIVQQFSVRPNESVKEQPYIARNITATRAAYGLTNVAETPYLGVAPASAASIAASTGIVPNIRLLDPNVLQPTFEQLQQIRAYYGFPATLDIDRYTIGGSTSAYVVAAREVDQSGLQPDQRNWINEHLVYTHGFGFVAAPADHANADGAPAFSERDIPPSGPIPISQPRIYFGELSPKYSITGTKQQELDYSSSGGANQYDVYRGNGGVQIGSWFRRLLYAVRFGDRNILLSSSLTSQSRILYIRDPLQRVQEVAPYLQLDSDPYPAVVDGRIVWIVDGYTTSDGYPYSQRETLGSIASDSQSASTDQGGPPQDQVNYIRNSVKATVDAYDGTVRLYTWDPTDPVLKAWMHVFPGTVLPKSAIPPDLVPHLRYPTEMFEVQRDLFAQYHVTSPKDFYTKQDFWGVPADPQNPQGGTQPPAYILGQLPGDAGPEFNIMSPLVFRGRANLAAYFYVSGDPADYGQLRALELPQTTQVNGPQQVDAAFQAFPQFSTQKTLLDQGGSSVIMGNLIALPISNGLLYVDPVYVQSAGGSSYPLLQKVLVNYGSNIGYGNTLADALDSLFGAGAGSGAAGSGSTGGAGVTGAVSAQLVQAFQQAEQAYQAAQAALAKVPPDFAGYGTAEQQLGAALARINALLKQEQKPTTKK